MATMPFSPAMKDQVEEFYFVSYARHFGRANFAQALATIPSREWQKGCADRGRLGQGVSVFLNSKQGFADWSHCLTRGTLLGTLAQ